MSSPLVSVIVPVHNGERHLAEALSSILAQTYRPIEVIVVNDGSDDRTAEIASSTCGPVRVISQDRMGPAGARNTGIVAAGGAFVAFLDHDDLWIPEKLATQMAAFDDDPALEVCVGHIQNFEDPEPGASRKPLAAPVPGFVSITMLVRRSVFDRVGLLDPSSNHSDSAEWFLRGADGGLSVRLLPEVLTLRRIHDGNRSRHFGDRSRAEFLRLARSRIARGRSQPAGRPGHE